MKYHTDIYHKHKTREKSIKSLKLQIRHRFLYLADVVIVHEVNKDAPVGSCFTVHSKGRGKREQKTYLHEALYRFVHPCSYPYWYWTKKTNRGCRVRQVNSSRVSPESCPFFFMFFLCMFLFLYICVDFLPSTHSPLVSLVVFVIILVSSLLSNFYLFHQSIKKSFAMTSDGSSSLGNCIISLDRTGWKSFAWNKSIPSSKEPGT